MLVDPYYGDRKMAPLKNLPQKHKVIILVGVVALIALGGFAIFGSRGLVHLWALEEKQLALEGLAFRLQQDNEHLQQHIDRLDHDDAYLEKVVRERLGWVHPGEVVYRVRRSIAPPPADRVARTDQPAPPAAPVGR